MVLGIATNWLAAGLLAFTIAFYGIVYTLWLKRRTPQNIVIGGLAGALPPLVGWAAASGSVPPNAWLMVAIIFIWTPPHFLGSVALHQRRLRQGRRADDAGRPRRAIDPAPDPGLQRGPGAGRPDAGGHRIRRAGLPGDRGARRRDLRGARGETGDRAGSATSRKASGKGLYDTPPVIAPARDLFAFSIGYLFTLFAVLLGEHLAADRAAASPVSGSLVVSDPNFDDPAAARARRGRNIAIALSLAAFVVIVFVITLIKKSGG